MRHFLETALLYRLQKPLKMNFVESKAIHPVYSRNVANKTFQKALLSKQNRLIKERKTKPQQKHPLTTLPF